jgi:hypothetical protein
VGVRQALGRRHEEVGMSDISHAIEEGRLVGGIVYETYEEADAADRGYRLNEYTVSRQYGGPEEGGWWYTLYDPTGRSIMLGHFVSFTEANRSRDQLQSFADLELDWRAPRGLYSVTPGTHHILWSVEQHEPRREPAFRPHYE